MERQKSASLVCGCINSRSFGGNEESSDTLRVHDASESRYEADNCSDSRELGQNVRKILTNNQYIDILMSYHNHFENKNTFFCAVKIDSCLFLLGFSN